MNRRVRRILTGGTEGRGGMSDRERGVADESRSRSWGRRMAVREWPALLVAAACLGLSTSVWVRPGVTSLLSIACLVVVAALLTTGPRRLALAGLLLALAGLWWGSLRSDALDRSFLATRLGESESARVVVTGPGRRTPFALRVPAEVVRFGTTRFRERVLLELPPERAPPQGAVLELRAQPVAPRGPETGFDERGWLARRGVHVVLRGEGARIVGRRGGIGGVADRLRAHMESTIARGTTGERRALLAGIVLGEDEGLDQSLRSAFEASGLMHLLAVSGQNMAITAIGVVAVARVVGVGRLVGEGVAILVVLAYALAVGWQPSVVRAAVAGVLASLAWIVARPRDRWHALSLGALVLLAWMPSSALEPGFQLSFAAVAAIFVALPRVVRRAGRLSGAPAALGRDRCRGRLRCRDGADRLAPLWRAGALDGARQRRSRAGDAAAHRARARRGRDRAGPSRRRCRVGVARRLVCGVDRARRPSRFRLAGRGAALAGRPRSDPHRRRLRDRAATRTAISAAVGRRGHGLGRARARSSCLCAAADAVLGASLGAPDHVSRRRSGRRHARRGAGRGGARRPGAAGSGRRRSAAAARDPGADGRRADASPARPHRRRG